MRVIGIALAPGASEAGGVTVSLCTLAPGGLVVDGFVDMDGLEMVENLLGAAGPWVAGVDAPLDGLPLGHECDAWHLRAAGDAAPALVHPDHRMVIEADPARLAERLAGDGADREAVLDALGADRFAARWGWSLEMSDAFAPMLEAAEDSAGNAFRSVLIAVEAATGWSRLTR